MAFASEERFRILLDGKQGVSARANPPATPAGVRGITGVDTAPPSGVLPLAGIDVLLVEDIEDNQVLYGTLLRSRGARVAIANDGLSGCKAAFLGAFGVVLMDIQMPVLDGYEAMAKLRAGGYLRPVIALTAHAMKGESDLCREAGFAHYLTKPVSCDVLTRVVAAFAGKSTGLNAPAAERSQTRTSRLP